jgi:hypothetical protein
VRLKLHKTCCMYKGEPVYISVDEQNADHKVRMIPLAAVLNASPSAYKLVDYTEDAFDYRYMSLGYITYKKNAYYLSRLPERKAHQGLKYDCIYSEPNLSELYSYHYFYTKEMVDCIKGKHATVEEALNMLHHEGYKKVSVHRDFAVGWVDSMKIGMYYREQLISIKEDNTPHFNLIQGRASSFIQKVMEASGL